MQPVDFTTLTAICVELRANWLPARLEQVYQRDRFTIALSLRTLNQRGWLTLCWHPQAARICISDPPPRTPDTFTFSQQLRHQLNGLALTAIEAIAPWERALDLQFARRPGDPPLWHLYVEVMNKYSNVILTTADQTIVTAAHQVSSQQSSVRPIQTGQPYEFPPRLTDPAPSLSETQEHWQERVSLIPGSLKRNLVKNYRGLSTVLVTSMVQAADLDPERSTDSLTDAEWQRLFSRWQEWLTALEQEKFNPGWLSHGYTVMGWGATTSAESVQDLINRYYSDQLNQQDFTQLRHQISQRLANLLKKLYLKAKDFQTRLQQSDEADQYRAQADLLMAHLHEWQPGMKAIPLKDFETEQPVTIPLDPEKNAVQNAQALYKRHQKLKRSRLALEPLLAEVQTEIDYLEQVEVAIAQLNTYQTSNDLASLEEIRDELIQQQYLVDPEGRNRNSNTSETEFRRYQTPSGFEVLVGRNNRQNDQLTFRLAGDYDLWFHAQEIPGSHVLLRLSAGAAPDEADLQFTADLAAYYSRAQQSDQVPVIYTEPKHVYKPKGAKPGIAIYKQEQVIWGQPQRLAAILPTLQ
ncbi:NFACT family protein [Oscillatoria sp. FACHB-1407]|uniref:Rqc2 family fibronectin-binding protein n=1 Tax=Oscillatoria sp. FACHB-1407 TaxID=2692847 RepID=UPI001687A6BA|nr:NFACT RNA binding domain-containing protein [Oscillatoria sp. FACHB-1407]MBD2459613.1 NFACT family protein [Oscillatoria sp. FACHB-1407]